MRYKIDRISNAHFHCDNCGFRKNWGDSQRDMEYLINKDGEMKLYELCREDELIEEELDATVKELVQLIFCEQKHEKKVLLELQKIKSTISKICIFKKLDKLLFHV